MLSNDYIAQSMTIRLGEDLPETTTFCEGIRHAPDRGFRLSKSRTMTALKNGLRYIPEKHHTELIPEFLHELRTRGRIYGYRFRPAGPIKAKPVDAYKGNCLAGKAFQLMIDNNLDFDVALYPYELVTYGETGSVCQNWMQYLLIKKYLEALTDEQTLVVQSGHPLGLFASGPEAPRVIITNGLMVGLYDNLDDWEIAAQMGRFFLRANDRRGMDVHRSPGDCTRHLYHTAQRGAAKCAGFRPGGIFPGCCSCRPVLAA